MPPVSFPLHSHYNALHSSVQIDWVEPFAQSGQGTAEAELLCRAPGIATGPAPLQGSLPRDSQ